MNRMAILASLWLQMTVDAWWNAWLNFWEWLESPTDDYSIGSYTEKFGFEPTGDCT